MLIDTNFYSALDAGKASAVEALKSQTKIYVPVMVAAELQYGFLNGSRQQENLKRLQQFLSLDFVEVLLPAMETAEHYAAMAMYCKKSGRALTHNDLWIAALAKQHDLRFATYDQDFRVFNDLMGSNLLILQ